MMKQARIMKRLSLVLPAIIVLLGFAATTGAARQENPLLTEFNTPFQAPPFDKIKVEHYLPAFELGIKEHDREMAAIVDNPAPATFANTIEALAESGVLLNRVDDTFGVLNAVMSNEQMQGLANKLAALRTRHEDDIRLNEKLFARIKAVYDQRDQLFLTPEKLNLVERFYKDAVRGGINLDAASQDKLRKMNEELAQLATQFGQNLLKENKAFQLVIENPDDLAGLPQRDIDGASQAAKDRGLTGKWVFTLDKPSLIPFLQFADRRELREKMFKAYLALGNNHNANDNKTIIARIARLRQTRAKLLGFRTHADFVLEQNMAKTPERVYRFLEQVWEPALRVAKKEAAELQALVDQESKDFKLQPWDWWYYAEKIRKTKYDVDENILKPYFKLENVRDGVFYVAGQLYGLKFIQRNDLLKYHADVQVFEIQEADGSHVGIIYLDYYPRAGKRNGAWSNSFRKQAREKGRRIYPVVTNNGNFPRPTADTPSMLSYEEVETLFHEFGHALHNLLSDCTYEVTSGSSVPRDFVELPSQIMENWAFEPEVLKIYARHYRTGEVMPQELIDKLVRSRLFNEGFKTVEYLAASFLDMDWHTLPKEGQEIEVEKFEADSMARIGLIPEIASRYRSTYFNHIFSGGYPSGYYSYIWAEVLDADAFAAFKETSLFDRHTARLFRDNILAKGGTEEPATLYRRFRGSEPGIRPLLEKRGLLDESDTAPRPKTALLLIDIQDFYFPGGKRPLKDPEKAGLNAAKLLEKFRQQEQSVVHVRHNAAQGADIQAHVRPLPNEKVITKNQVNSFRDTDLYEYLKAQGIERLVICGMQTHMCLEGTVRAAADFGFDCIVVHDACATRDLEYAGKKIKAEDVHYSTLSTLDGNYAKVIDTATFLKEY